MKKLFLSSSFEDTQALFPAFAATELTGKTVTFIPTAAIPEKYKAHVKSGKKALEAMGLTVDELEVSTATQEEIAGKLQRNDFIYVSGGNTFFLLQELQKSGADNIILEQIQAGKIYIGESAGSIIVSPNIEYVKDMDDCTAAPQLSNFDALNAVSFYPLPHKDSFPFAEAVETITAHYEKALPLLSITNAQVILVKGDTHTIMPL